MKSGLNNEGASICEGVPQIVIAKGLLPRISEYVTGFYQNHGQNLETGGMLTGRFLDAGTNPLFHITGFIDAGPHAECAPESVLFDAEYQARALQSMRLEDPLLGNMGCIHVHPDHMDVCSQGDWEADIEAVRASDTKALLFAIITLDNPRTDPLSLFYRRFKFDFFVLSEAFGWEYQHVRPTIEERPALQGAPAQTLLAGEAGPAALQARHCAWWPGLLKDKKRLVAEVRAMEERYGGRATLRLDGKRLYWEYTVVESGRHFPIQVRYPRRYPFEPPRIVSMLPLPGSPHQLPGNEICWTDRLGQCEWNPARDTAATCIHAAHRWFACLLVFLTLGKWPSEADDDLR